MVKINIQGFSWQYCLQEGKIGIKINALQWAVVCLLEQRSFLHLIKNDDIVIYASA